MTAQHAFLSTSVQSRSQSFVPPWIVEDSLLLSMVPLDQRSENESSESNHFIQACAIDADCAVDGRMGWAEFGYFLCYFKMVGPRALIFRPLVKGNEALGTRID